MTSMGERRGSYNGLDEIPEEKGHLEDISVDRSIILKWVLKKLDGRDDGVVYLDQCKSQQWTVVNRVMNFFNSVNGGESLANSCSVTVNFSEGAALWS